nr:fibropellin-3-like [Lytechinus pictus]
MGLEIVTNDNAPALKGFMLQARHALTSGSRPIIGTWSLGDTSNYKYLDCNGANSAVTHSNNNDKPASIQFSWTTPNDVVTGNIYFTATFVQSRNVFWVGETSSNITNQCFNGDICGDNGICSVINGGVRCTCTDGYTGIICTTPPASDLCNPNPCLSGGNCTQNGNTFTCTCPDLTTGSTCNIKLTPCDSDPCLNGATCTNSADNTTFMCDCPSDYTGTTCDTGKFMTVCTMYIPQYHQFNLHQFEE